MKLLQRHYLQKKGRRGKNKCQRGLIYWLRLMNRNALLLLSPMLSYRRNQRLIQLKFPKILTKIVKNIVKLPIQLTMRSKSLKILRIKAKIQLKMKLISSETRSKPNYLNLRNMKMMMMLLLKRMSTRRMSLTLIRRFSMLATLAKKTIERNKFLMLQPFQFSKFPFSLHRSRSKLL